MPGSDEIALFPLQTVLFPGARLPLRLFEQRYLEMAKSVLRDNSVFGVCRILEGSEVGAPALAAPVGCLARIESWDMQQLGVLQIVALGERRFRVLDRHVAANGLAWARTELLAEEVDAPVPERYAPLIRLLERGLGERAGDAQARFDSSLWVSSQLAQGLPLPLEFKQALLELDAADERLGRLFAALAQSGALGQAPPTD